jgi:hypothetical protein
MFGRMNKKISIDKLYLARIGIVKDLMLLKRSLGSELNDRK